MPKSKLTQKELLLLLEQAGVKDVELVDKDEDSDLVTSATSDKPLTLTAMLQLIDSNRRAILEPQIITTKKDELHGEVNRRVNDSLRKKLHELTNIPKQELAEETDTDAMLKKALDYHNSIIGKGKEDLIAERDTLMAKHKQSLEELRKEKEKEVSQVREQLTAKQRIDILTDLHNNYATLPKDFNRKVAAQDFDQWLKSQANVKINEKGDFELYDLEKPDVRLYDDGKTKFLTPLDFFEKRYGKDGLNILTSDTRGIDPAKEMSKVKPASQHPVKADDGRILSPIDQQLNAAAAWAGQ